MKIKSLKLTDFRNFSDLKIDFDPGTNVIYGENGQGKTNLLEAVFLLSCAKSFRARKQSEIVLFGKKKAKISAEIESLKREATIDIELGMEKKTSVSVNHVKLLKSRELFGYLRSVLFLPDDLYIIRQGPAARRRFADVALSQLKPYYLAMLAEYHRVLDGKNKILRDGEENPSLFSALDVYSDRLAHLGAGLIVYRREFCKKLRFYAAEMHNGISGGKERLDLSYATDRYLNDEMGMEEIEDGLKRHIADRREAEIAAKTSLIGPHRDDILIRIDENEAGRFASQGQTKTAAIALKLAERAIFCDETGETPILLLDDVLSELDEMRQNFVLNRISDGQILITCCEPSKINSVLSGARYHIKNGQLVE